jgi:hypothetical protein
MPQHEIEIELPPKSVLNSDVVFTVRSDDQLLGELKVSKGSVAWRPSGHRREFHLEWEAFDEFMRDRGRSHWLS